MKDKLVKADCPDCIWIGNCNNTPIFVCEGGKVDNYHVVADIAGRNPTDYEKAWAKQKVPHFYTKEGKLSEEFFIFQKLLR